MRLLDILKQIQREEHLTDTEMAKRLRGMHRVNWCNIKNGKKRLMWDVGNLDINDPKIVTLFLSPNATNVTEKNDKEEKRQTKTTDHQGH